MEENRIKDKALSINLASVTLWALAVFSIGDIVTTLIEKYTSPVFNETNPISVLYNLPIELILVMKIIVTSYIIYFSFKLYKYKIPVYIRYMIVYMIVIVTLLNIGVVINNIQVINIPDDQKRVMPEDVKVESYVNAVGQMELIQPKRTPTIIWMVALNIIQFAVWRSYEKCLLIKKQLINI